MRHIAKVVAEWLVNTGVISVTLQEVYEYGIFSLLFSLLPLMVVILLSIPLGMVMEGCIMVVPFILLRKFTGGFHFSTPLPCMILSVTLLLSALIAIKYTMHYHSYFILSVLVAFSVLPIIVYSPIDSQSRKLTENEKKTFKKVAIVLSCAFVAAYFVLSLLSLSRFAVPIGFGIFLTALLQVPCCFSKHQFPQ